jgi:ABC-type lipoprotein release transport system permease subunit
MLSHLKDNQAPIAFREVIYGHSFSRRNGKNDFRPSIRGTDPQASAEHFRAAFRIVAGRISKPGSNELVVDTTARQVSSQLTFGGTIHFASKRLHIVGIFKIKRQVDNLELRDSQINLQQAFQCRDPYSVVRVHLQKATMLNTFRAYLETISQVNLRTELISFYRANIASTMRRLIVTFGIMIEVMLLILEWFGENHAIRALLEARTREIGLVRSPGFQRISIFSGLLIEILAIALAGSFVAVALASITFVGRDFYSIISVAPMRLFSTTG